MNVKELNERVRNNQKEELEETIKDIERKIIWMANNGFNNIEIATDDDDYYYTIRKRMMKPLRDYFENEGYKIEVKEVKRVTKWLQKLLGIYSPVYLMTISWEEV